MDLTVILNALGDPSRFNIFQQLLQRKHCTRSLSIKLGISEAAVSQHLKILRESGLVYREKYGYHTHYLPSRDALDYLADSFDGMRKALLQFDSGSRDCQCEYRQQMENFIISNIMKKGENIMRIAVTYENGEIFQHFGHTAQFKLYDAEDGKIINQQIVDTNGSGHGLLAGFLQQANVDALICGGIGMGAQNALADAGIKLYAGVQGSADAAAQALAEGTLEYDPDAHCDHHGHHHGGECGHDHCGEHHCAGN